MVNGSRFERKILSNGPTVEAYEHVDGADYPSSSIELSQYEPLCARPTGFEPISRVGRLLLVDYGLNEEVIQGICHGLDKLFSIVRTYVGVQRVPMFGLIVNGQSQSEVRGNTHTH